MDDTPGRLEQLWNDLLSRQPELVREAFNSLDSASQSAVHAHLERMAHDPGWHPEQRQSALSALRALGNRPEKGE